MRYLIAMAAAALFASSASADSMDDTLKARELGQIVGSADVCEYSLDADKVSGLVSDALAGMGPMSRSAYEPGLGAQKVRLKKMNEVERKVACATQQKLASKYGILAK